MGDKSKTGDTGPESNGLLPQPQNEKKGKRMSILSNFEHATKGMEFRHTMARSAKAEYHDLVGHHEPNAGHSTEEDEEIFNMTFSQRKVYDFLHHWTFESSAAGVIVANAFVMGMAAELNVSYNADNPDNTKTVSNGFLDVCGYIFFAFYTLELLMRFFALRCTFFTGGDKIWNCLDLILVLTAVWDIIEKEVLGGSGGGNVSFFRMLRLLKMMKMLRVFRVMKFFRELRVMMYAIAGSMRLLFWAMLMLSLITYMFSLVFLQGVNQYLTSDNVDPDIRSEALLYYGSVGTSMVTLFEAISGGNDWSPLAAPLKTCGDFYYFIFLFYIAFLTVTVLNVLTGVVVDAAMQLAEIDGENVTDEFMCNHLNDHNKIHELVDHMELNGDGFIQWDEVMEGRENCKIRDFFDNMDVDVEEVEGFFRLMQCAGKEGKVKTAEFIKGCGNLKLWGPSKSIESFLLMKDLSRLKKSVNDNNQKILACFARQGVELPDEDEPDLDEEHDFFTHPVEYADGDNAPDPIVPSGNWSQLVDRCSDVTLLNSMSSRVAQRIESLSRQAANQKPVWQKKKQMKPVSPGGQSAGGDEKTTISEESVSQLASLIVKEAMPQLLQEVEKKMRSDGLASLTPEPKMFGQSTSEFQSTPTATETKDPSDDKEDSRDSSAKGKKKFKGFKGSRPSNKAES